MRSKQANILIVGLTVLGLSAGVVTGMLVSRLPALNHTQANDAASQSPLVEELQLTPDQQDKMRGIWEGVRTQAQQCYQDAQDLQTQRDNAIVALLNDEQKAKFQSLTKKFADQYEKIRHDRDAAFDQAVEKTNAILKPEQQAKYAEILKSRRLHMPATTKPIDFQP